jgi:hypothetical protein
MKSLAPSFSRRFLKELKGLLDASKASGRSHSKIE